MHVYCLYKYDTANNIFQCVIRIHSLRFYNTLLRHMFHCWGINLESRDLQRDTDTSLVTHFALIPYFANDIIHFRTKPI